MDMFSKNKLHENLKLDIQIVERIIEREKEEIKEKKETIKKMQRIITALKTDPRLKKVGE